MPKPRISLYIAAGLFFISLIFLLLLIPPLVLNRTGGGPAMTALGIFLFKSFSYAALYIPVYLMISASLVLKEIFFKRSAAVLMLSTIPFLTLSLFFKVLEGGDSPATVWITGRFTPKEAAFLLFLLFLAEVLSLFVVNMKLSGRTGDLSGGRQLELPPPEAEDLIPVEDEDIRTPEERIGSKNSVPDTEKGPGLFPELPDVPEFNRDRDPFYNSEDSADTAEDFESVGGRETDVYPDFRSGFDPGFAPDRMPESGSPESETESAGESGREAGNPEPETRNEDLPKTRKDPGLPFRLELQKVSPSDKKNVKYEIPADRILNDYTDSHYWIIDEDTRKAADVLKETLEEFKIKAEVTGIKKGPVITMFEILPAPGVKLSKIVNLADNIALRLAASRIRIVAPIPGKHAVGIEVPNKYRAIVSFKEMLEDEIFSKPGVEIPIVLGKDITGESQIVDLVQTPHLLIAGATGSGKSVCVNSIICSILYKRKPEEVRLILIDPKIVELKLYNDIPHLLTPVITEPKRAYQALQYCIYEMERRYALLDSLGVRDIRAYNKKLKKGKYAAEPLPYIVVIVDEFADLIATSGKELESTLARLAAMARAVGIHLVLATQRPSIDVITGLIKANVPSRIAFMVANKIDSRIILDAVGADKLLGKGDMLFASAWDPSLMRIQGAYVSDEEVERLTDYVKTLGEPDYIDEEIFFDSDEEESGTDDYTVNDPLMDKSIEIVASAGKASASYLQRRLKIGYNRAARIVEEMEARGIVGPQNGSKPREIIHIPDKYREN